MIKIGITGSLASGKTTASKILSKGRGPLFSADRIVRDLYQSEKFKLLIRQKLQINNHNRLKEVLKKFIFKSSKNINKLEKIKDGPCLFLANEFFDSFPIKQFLKKETAPACTHVPLGRFPKHVTKLQYSEL